MRRLGVAITGLELPAVEKIAESRAEDPFEVLIATLLSARTQDATTYAASERLFKAANTPEAMSRLSVRRIERLIYPVSFYRNNVGVSRYHGFALSIRHRLSRGLTYSAAYTRSTLKDTASSVFDASILTGPLTNAAVADSSPRWVIRATDSKGQCHRYSE